MKNISKYLAGLALIITILFITLPAEANYKFSAFEARPPIHVLKSNSKSPQGVSPQDIKKIYNLPATGGSGTIAIIGAYDSAYIEKDLQVFDTAFKLPECSSINKCFEKHVMVGTSGKISTNASWTLETALDVEWAHAIAPTAHILLVEAPTQSGKSLLSAIDYARNRSDVVAVSMSWGGGEFQDETSLDSHFINTNGTQFFASSGDSGAGVSWPAVSPYVIAVGGSSFATGITHETAWSGSGGGVSAYESEPQYQLSYSILRAHTMRAIPDVSYNADPKSGYSIYHCISNTSCSWYVVGGTSAGAPQWAAIQALGHSITHDALYSDKTSNNPDYYFKDIVSGSNGTCTYYCTARAHYDYVTGLGSPLTIHF